MVFMNFSINAFPFGYIFSGHIYNALCNLLSKTDISAAGTSFKHDVKWTFDTSAGMSYEEMAGIL